ncbi:hypothetical protein THAOC_22386 [Thalassiosira oceanica]|uniref:MYND-type domain-containing protein n=1 Tax=Thalassiosira oceanica TaxID=159749 RepID=K0RUN1_THAOC|nr:hypothetical protein THAOC_22386 [Thalassiosira oceanica]|eukprot:EJK57558.1 hypothetical protein THAOC_22386 [Thalassiosira oceanica]
MNCGGDVVCACANCGKLGSNTVRLKYCTACRLVKYCCVECQKAHRKQLKKACKQRAAELKDEELYGQGHERPEGDFCPICTRQYSSQLGRIRSNRVHELTMVRARVAKKDPAAIYHLGYQYYYGKCGLQRDMRKSVDLWTEAAELGSIEAHQFVLLRHIMISAKMGYTEAIESIKIMFLKGNATKEQYAEALNGYHQVVAEEMKSHDRDEETWIYKLKRALYPPGQLLIPPHLITFLDWPETTAGDARRRRAARIGEKKELYSSEISWQAGGAVENVRFGLIGQDNWRHTAMNCVPVADGGDESCANCGKTGSGTVKLKDCAACRLVKYCGVDCQKVHRKQHKNLCKQRVAELEDELLYSQGHERPEGDFCPICTLPIPLPMNEHSFFKVCCSKRICSGCTFAAKKRGMSGCPFCRTSLPDSDADVLASIQKRVLKKDPAAIDFLGRSYANGNLGLQRDMQKSVNLWTEAAELGSIEALCNLGLAHVTEFNDVATAVKFWTKAAMQGHVESRHNLGSNRSSKREPRPRCKTPNDRSENGGEGFS